MGRGGLYPTQRWLWNLIELKPGIRPSEMRDLTGHTKRIITKHLRLLRKKNLVCSHHSMQEGRARRYFARSSCPLHEAPQGPVPMRP